MYVHIVYILCKSTKCIHVYVNTRLYCKVEKYMQVYEFKFTLKHIEHPNKYKISILFFKSKNK